MLFRKLTGYIVPTFTVSLIVSYFSCLGYYFHFGLDITSFIGVEDLTIIFAKYVWFTLIGIIMILYWPYSYLIKESKCTWWDVTIGTSLIKRRIFIVIPSIISIIALAIIYRNVLDIIMMAYFISLVLFILVVAILTIIGTFSDKKQVTEVAARDWMTLLSVGIIFVVFIPVVAGLGFARYPSQEKVIVKFEDEAKPLITDGKTNIYIGKTLNYFFVYHPTTKTSTVYHMDKVVSFEVMPINGLNVNP